MTKITVLGAGAVGSMFGGLIKQHAPEIDVLLIGRGSHGAAMQGQQGVTLEGPWGTVHPRLDVSFDAADAAGSDLVLLTVKSQATEEAIQSLQPHLGEATVVSIQNGANQRTLLQYLPPEQVVVGMTATNMAIVRPGLVSLQLDGASVLGPSVAKGDMAAVERAAELLRLSKLRVGTHRNIVGVQYNKLAINAIGYASCVSASNFITEALIHRRWRESVGLPILAECHAAFDAAGVQLADIPGIPGLSRLERVFRLIDKPLVGGVVRAVLRRVYNKKPIVFSLYQDLRRGKTTEVDFINGEIVRLGREHGVETPVNAKVVALVHRLEERSDQSFLSRAEVIDECRAAGAATT